MTDKYGLKQEVLTYHGYSESAAGSPRMIIKTAYEAGMINDSESWLKALTARNNVAHSSNEDIAMSIINETKEIYVDMFGALKEIIEKNWI